MFLNSNKYRCTSTEYGINMFLGIPAKTENPPPFDLAKTGMELYYQAAWEPYILKVSGGKMMGRPVK